MKFHWGHGIFIFISIFLLLSVIFIIFSLNQSQDLVSDDYYDQGASYSKQIEINKRSYAYIDSVSLSTSDSTLSISMCKSMVSLSDTLNVYFYRPSDKKADIKRSFPLADNLNMPLAGLKSGRYVVKLSWKQKNELYNVDKEISIK